MTILKSFCGVASEQSYKSFELFAWGDNSSGCLGLPVENLAVFDPRAMEPYGLLPGERVVSISCSERSEFNDGLGRAATIVYW